MPFYIAVLVCSQWPCGPWWPLARAKGRRGQREKKRLRGGIKKVLFCLACVPKKGGSPYHNISCVDRSVGGGGGRRMGEVPVTSLPKVVLGLWTNASGGQQFHHQSGSYYLVLHPHLNHNLMRQRLIWIV